jgi:ABC-type nitrate/sulfonate/bicarbonate transport system permease component
MKKKFIPQNIISVLCGIASIFAFVIFWFIYTNGSTLGKMIPRPDVVIISLFKDIFNPIGQHTLLIHVCYSMYRVLVGYVIGSIVGIILGLAMGWSKVVEAIFSPLFRIIRPIPPIAWIPISIIWLGLGENAKIFLIFLASFSNVTLNAWTGAKNVDPKLIGASQMLGARKSQIFFTIVLPASIPQIFAGLQVALSSCWGTILAAEMVRSSEGLGWIIVTGGNNNDMKQILVGIVTIGIVGFILAVIMRKLEAVLCRWNKSGT